MKTNTQKIALIPAYKPDSKLADLSRDLTKNGFSVIVVNDGSGCKYAEIFRNTEKYAEVLIHLRNRGKGAALKTGLEYIKKFFVPPYTVVTVDADGQHSVEDTIRVSEAAAESPDSLILGSRGFKGGAKVPLRSRLGNRITSLVFLISSGKFVRDTQTGLRAFSNRAVERMLSIEGERYEYEMNVLMDYARGAKNIIEVPIRTIYLNNNASSHFDTVRDSARIYREIIRFSASSLISFCIDYALFCMFSGVFGILSVANITARIFSSTANYAMNRRFVFGSCAPVKKSMTQYFALAALVLLCNTALLTLIVGLTPINRYVAKMITECVMFVFSWAVQKTMIFKTKAAEGSKVI